MQRRNLCRMILGAAAASAARGAFCAPARGEPDGFIRLEGGKCVIGSPASERQRGSDEQEHTVTLSPFFVDPFEVTQKDYAAVMGANPSHFRGDDLPVESVTWYEAVEYCNRLSERRGLRPAYRIEGQTVTWDRSADGYRLLTEAEWEYAARAGTRTVFPTGRQITADQANYEGDYPYLIEENYVIRRDPGVVTGVNRGETLPVRSLRPSSFGLWQMHGNVSEWCFDYWAPYGKAPETDPAGPSRGHLRIARGGSYIDFGKHLRSAYRSACAPWRRDQGQGFRIARNAAPLKGSVRTEYVVTARLPASPRVLIAYFSYSGNTRRAAELLRRQTGYDMVEIAMKEPYRGNIYEASQKHLFAGVHPELTARVAGMDRYDVILLGYPTWWATVPMPVCTFLESYSFAGKVVLPFSSHGGTIWGDSLSDLAKMIPGAYVGEGFEFNYSGGWGLQRRLAEWVKRALGAAPR